MDPKVPTMNRGTEIVRLLAGVLVSESDTRHASVDLPVTIARNSDYLCAQINSFKGDDHEVTVTIPGATTAAVRLYAWWLEMGDMPLFLHDVAGLVVQPQHSLTWKDCFDLIQAHLLGSTVSDSGFQRYILAQLNRWLSPRQDPDWDLLDYLWYNDEQIVSDELLHFVTSHMLQMKSRSVRLLVEWMRRSVEAKRRWGRVEHTKEIGKSRAVDDYSCRSKTSVRELPRRASERSYDTLAPNTYSLPATEWDVLPESVSQDVIIIPPDGNVLASRTKSRRNLHGSISTSIGRTTTRDHGERQFDKSAEQHHSPARHGTRRLESLSHRKELPDLSTYLRLDPKASATTSDAHIAAEIKMQRNSSLRTPSYASLPPSMRQSIAQISKLARHKTLASNRQDDSLESRMPEHEKLLLATGGPEIPAMRSQSLQSLDFWTDPDDVPGPEFFNVPVEASPRSVFPAEGAPTHLDFPQPNASKAKQIIQSFKLTRTPTPRRRSTRSWSVASIRSHEKGKFMHHGSVAEKPGRGLISRKPVSKAGMDFLGTYTDGDTIKRIISLNSRPIKPILTSNRNGSQDREEEFDWNTQVRRPGTA